MTQKRKDLLTIKALQVSTTIGVYAWEQRIKQQLLLDICIPMDFSTCEDELSHTLDYDVLCKKITQFLEHNCFRLIETVANQVADLIKKEFNITEVSITVNKPHAIKNAGAVQVTIMR